MNPVAFIPGNILEGALVLHKLLVLIPGGEIRGTGASPHGCCWNLARDEADASVWMEPGFPIMARGDFLLASSMNIQTYYFAGSEMQGVSLSCFALSLLPLSFLCHPRLSMGKAVLVARPCLSLP